MGKRRDERLRRQSKNTLIEMLLVVEGYVDCWVAENGKLKNELKQTQRELDSANHQLHVHSVHGDYIRMAERLEHVLIDLRGAKADRQILEEALADKKAGNPNWENVAELKMRKARY